MSARIKTMLGKFAASIAFLLVTAAAGEALAADCGCTTPTAPTTPTTSCCQHGGGHNGNGGSGWGGGGSGGNVYINGSVTVNASASASASASSSSSAWSSASSAAAARGGAGQGAGATSGYGGGGGGYLTAPASGLIQGMAVEGAGQGRAAYEASRTLIRKVAIQAVCMDDRDTPHPASQVAPDRDIENGFDGEIYRCIAGSRMQATIADYNGKIAFDHGQTLACAKGDALYHMPASAGQGGGQVVCRPQKPARDCNERSLLRRFGPGVKILSLVSIEKYTAYREETTQTTLSSMTLDGGVGGVMN